MSDQPKAEGLKAKIGLSGPPLHPVPDKPPLIPDHEMLRRIGRGSYGEVWLARNAVGTLRAVKAVYRARFNDPRPYEREFIGIQKYEPISRSNEGLVDVLQIGRNDAEGYFYYVMELADDASAEATGPKAEPDSPKGVGTPRSVPAPFGTSEKAPARLPAVPELVAGYCPKTLAGEIRSRGRVPLSECVPLGITLNLALGHLHRNGLIHRDVKPSNIIFVNAVPKLADIGLVTDLAEAQSFVGTEGFIPPEGPNSPQADLYAIGKVLYEAAMGKDRNEFPEPYTHLGLDTESRGLMELNAVLLRACAPTAKERYQSAEEMNADLALLHSGKSVQQKHALERRLRLMTRIGVVSIAVVVLSVIPSFWAIKEAKSARAEAKHARLAEAEVKDELRTSYLAQAEARRRGPGIGRRFEALELVRKAAEIRPSLELRNEAVACLALPDIRPTKRWDQVTVPAGAGNVDFDFCHGRYARRDEQGNISIRSLENDSEQLLLPGFGATPGQSVFFSPTGRLLVGFGGAGTNSKGGAIVWNVARAQRVLTLTNNVYCHAFDTAEQLIVLAMAPKQRLLVFDLSHGEQGVTIPIKHEPFSLQIHPDGRKLAVSYIDRPEVDLFDLASAQVEQSHVFPADINGLAWHPNGKWLAAASADSRIYFWDMAAQTNRNIFAGHQGQAIHVQFAHNGDWLASSSWDCTFRLWDIMDGKQILSARNLGSVFRGSSDGQWWGHQSWDGRRVGIWQAATEREMRPLRNLENPEAIAARSEFHPSGRLIATVYDDGVRVWNIESGREVAWVRTDGQTDLAFSSKGDELFLDKNTGLWEWPLQIGANGDGFQTGQPSRLGLPGPVRHLSASRSADLAYTHGGIVHLMNLLTRQEKQFQTRTRYNHVSLSPDGKWLAAWTSQPSLFDLWETTTGTLIKRLEGYGLRGFAAFSANGRWLAVGGAEGYTMWDVASWVKCFSRTNQPDFNVRDVVFSPDSRILAISHSETVVQLLETATGAEIATLEGSEAGPVRSIAFSPDGTRFAVTWRTHGIDLWDLRLIRSELEAMNLDWDMPPYPHAGASASLDR